MEVTAYQKGIDRLKARANRLPKTVRRRMTEAAKANAKALRDAVLADAPSDTGELKTTVVYYAAPNTDGLVWRVVAGVKGEKGFYARFVEFGTSEQPAQPFFFSNYRIMKARFSARMSRAMKKGIKESK